MSNHFIGAPGPYVTGESESPMLDTRHGSTPVASAKVKWTGQDNQDPVVGSFKEEKMKLKTLIAILGFAILGFACTDTDHYPLSGDECAPEDPVQDLTVQQCAPAV